MRPPTARAANHTDRALASGSCSLATPIGIPGFGEATVVRGHRYTVEKPSGCTYTGASCSRSSLDPLCGSSADGCVEEACFGTLDVRFNTRSYILAGSAATQQCDSVSFGTDYSCVNYESGALKLAGKTLSVRLNLAGAGCGCNVAIYLVAMSNNPHATECDDYYCDANSVCGFKCAEIDLIEANSVAFVTTVHVSDDSEGASFGLGHYVTDPERRLQSKLLCPYGPDPICAINTLQPFTAHFRFSSSGSPFEYTVSLEQGGRKATVPQPVRYVDKPTKGGVQNAAEANAQLRARLDSGMTLALSYWAGETPGDMSWLDSPCTQAEMASWGCTDGWMQHREWEWTCDKHRKAVPSCSSSWVLINMSVAMNDWELFAGAAIVVAVLAIAWVGYALHSAITAANARPSLFAADGAEMVPVMEGRSARVAPSPKPKVGKRAESKKSERAAKTRAPSKKRTSGSRRLPPI